MLQLRGAKCRVNNFHYFTRETRKFSRQNKQNNNIYANMKITFEQILFILSENHFCLDYYVKF